LGTRTIFLEVNEKHVPARRLCQSAGFNAVCRREGYYPERSGRNSSALLLRCELP
jgi:hypothetical protein